MIWDPITLKQEDELRAATNSCLAANKKTPTIALRVAGVDIVLFAIFLFWAHTSTLTSDVIWDISIFLLFIPIMCLAAWVQSNDNVTFMTVRLAHGWDVITNPDKQRFRDLNAKYNFLIPRDTLKRGEGAYVCRNEIWGKASQTSFFSCQIDYACGGNRITAAESRQLLFVKLPAPQKSIKTDGDFDISILSSAAQAAWNDLTAQCGKTKFIIENDLAAISTLTGFLKLGTPEKIEEVCVKILALAAALV